MKAGKLVLAMLLLMLISGFGKAVAQEVLNGSYVCTGNVFGPQGVITVRSELSATSGITSFLAPTSRRFEGLSSDLATLAQQCRTYVESVLSFMPAICTVGPLEPALEPIAEGWAFDFSCFGNRDQIMNTISVLSRLPLVTALQ